VSSREELQAELAEQMQAFQARVDAFDELAAARLGVNRTDLRCVEILMAQHTASPGELGPALGLTTGGVTAMLIRLERLGYLRRVPHPDDGRKVIVQVTDEVLQQVAELYVPIAEGGHRLLGAYSDAEVELLTGFLRAVRELYDGNLERVRGLS
jgi:DNA-binding MarR family transcriptional regulator